MGSGGRSGQRSSRYHRALRSHGLGRGSAGAEEQQASVTASQSGRNGSRQPGEAWRLRRGATDSRGRRRGRAGTGRSRGRVPRPRRGGGRGRSSRGESSRRRSRCRRAGRGPALTLSHRQRILSHQASPGRSQPCARRRAAPGTFSAGRFYVERFRRRTTSSAVRCSPVQRAAGRRGYRDERRQGDEQLPSETNYARPHGERDGRARSLDGEVMTRHHVTSTVEVTTRILTQHTATRTVPLLQSSKPLSRSSLTH